MNNSFIDPVCLFHGKPWSDSIHWAGRCIFCCLCFKVFNSFEELYLNEKGQREDICPECAQQEKLQLEQKGMKFE